MKTLQLSSFGAPTDVVELVEVDPADPGPGQLAVSIEAAPINPSDLNLIRGVYGVRPELPAALGAEGVGRVIAVGDGVDGSRVGTRVLVVPTFEQATWREQAVLDERNAVPVDLDGDPLQLAMLGVAGRGEPGPQRLQLGAVPEPEGGAGLGPTQVLDPLDGVDPHREPEGRGGQDRQVVIAAARATCQRGEDRLRADQ